MIAASVFHDFRLGARRLARSPGFSLVAVLILGLGIGLTTAMFSIVYGVFLRGLPFEDSDRLLRLERCMLSTGEHLPVLAYDLRAWREQQASFKGLSAWSGISVNVSSEGDRPERYNGAYVTANTFDLAGVRPVLGRSFEVEEESLLAPLTVVLSDTMWRQRFGADPKVVGKSVRINGGTATVIGVMPAGFRFPLNQDLWLPLRIDWSSLQPGQGPFLQVFGRLAESSSIERARADLGVVAGRLASSHPRVNKGIGVAVTPYVEGYTQELRPSLYTLLVAVLGVLLIACANVANLLLVRAVQKTEEVGVRVALGAGRLRVAAQFLIEALLLAVAGCILGLGVAALAIRLYVHAMADQLPSFWMTVRLDSQVLLFAFGVTLLACLLSGVLPAAQVSKLDPYKILKDQARGSASLRLGLLSRALVVVEVSLCSGLLVATGLMILSVLNLRRIDLGFSPNHLLTGYLSIGGTPYRDTEDRLRFYDELSRRLKEIPRVRSAALATSLPGESAAEDSFEIEGGRAPFRSEAESRRTKWAAVTMGYFSTLDIHALQGRVFGSADGSSSEPVAIINQRFAERHFPGEAALGRRLRLGEEGEWRTIVGVVPDALLGEVTGDRAGLYLPLAQSPASWLTLAIRTHGAPLDLTSRLRDEIAAIDPDLPLFWVEPMEEKIANATRSYRVLGMLLTAFGLLSLFLASTGLYAIMAFSVSRRTRELGLRMACGARIPDILALILKAGLLQLAFGVALGLALAAAFSRTLSALLFRAVWWDPAVFISVAAVVICICLLACLAPALRASRVDPAVALRYERI